MCTDGAACGRRVCFFAHVEGELRAPPPDLGSGESARALAALLGDRGADAATLDLLGSLGLTGGGWAGGAPPPRRASVDAGLGAYRSYPPVSLAAALGRPPPGPGLAGRRASIDVGVAATLGADARALLEGLAPRTASPSPPPLPLGAGLGPWLSPPAAAATPLEPRFGDLFPPPPPSGLARRSIDALPPRPPPCAPPPGGRRSVDIGALSRYDMADPASFAAPPYGFAAAPGPGTAAAEVAAALAFSGAPPPHPAGPGASLEAVALAGLAADTLAGLGIGDRALRRPLFGGAVAPPARRRSPTPNGLVPPLELFGSDSSSCPPSSATPPPPDRSPAARLGGAAAALAAARDALDAPPTPGGTRSRPRGGRGKGGKGGGGSSSSSVASADRGGAGSPRSRSPPARDGATPRRADSLSSILDELPRSASLTQLADAAGAGGGAPKAPRGRRVRAGGAD